MSDLDLLEELTNLARIHHGTITPSRLHNPQRLDWRDCPCKTCKRVAFVESVVRAEAAVSADRAALIESIAQTERFRGGPCLCSDCVEKRADAEAAVDAVLAALAAADRETPDGER